jgi:hypothetical protein
MAKPSKTKAPNNEAITEALDRARVLQDRSVLESNDKKLVNHALEKYLADLDERYCQKLSTTFPTHAEWEMLHDLCVKFAILLGKAKTDYGAWDSSIQLIEGKYKKLPLRDFIEKIVKRLLTLPIPPCTSIYNSIQQCQEGTERRELQELYDVIRGKLWPCEVDAKPWAEWLKMLGRNPIATDGILLDLTKNESVDQKTAAFLLFRQMHHEQLMWVQQFDQATEPTCQWIYSLNNDEYYQALTKVFHGNAASPEQMRQYFAQDKNRERRRKSYRKTRNHIKRG